MTSAPYARWRSAGVALLFALASAGIVLAVFSPRYVVWRGLGIPDAQVFPEVNRAGDVLRQLHDPRVSIPSPSNRAIEWRLLFPVLGHALHLPDRAFLALPAVGCVGVLGLVAFLLRRRGWRPDETLAALLLLGAAPWFFVSTGWLAYFDSWLVLALLLVAFARSRTVLAGTVLLAPWIDERFVFILPVCLVVRGLERGDGSSLFSASARRDLVGVAAALVPFVLVRAGAIVVGRGGDGLALREIAAARREGFAWGGVAAGLWEGLRFGWLAILVFFVREWPLHRGRMLLLIGGGAAAVLVMFVLAADFSRSAAMLAPLLVVALVHGLRHVGTFRRAVLWTLAGLNLLAPAAHVVNDTRVRLHSLPHEIAACRAPPEVLRADPYNLRATLLLVEGRVEAAVEQLDYAVRLDPGYFPAHLNRSTAYGRLGRWPESLAAAERALALDATHPRAWYARAVARRQTGDARGALADAGRALALAPPADPVRPPVEALLAELRREF